MNYKDIVEYVELQGYCGIWLNYKDIVEFVVKIKSNFMFVLTAHLIPCFLLMGVDERIWMKKTRTRGGGGVHSKYKKKKLFLLIYVL